MRSNATNFIKRLKKQKEDALEYIIEHYSSLINAISYKILSDISQDAVNECVNDVYLSVWQHAKEFEGEPEDFKKWIGTVTKYKAIDRFRQLEKQRAREISDEYLLQAPAKEDVQMHLLKKEEKNTLLLAMGTLPDLDRDIFIMKYFQSLSNPEIAALLNLTIPAIENRLYRGKKKLSTNLHLKERLT